MLPTNSILRIGLLVYLCAGAAPAAWGGPSVGINFEGKTSLSNSAMDPGEVAGAEPQAFWNNAPNGAGSLSSLLDSTGAATGLSVAWRGAGSYLPITNNPGNQRLMRGLITHLGTDPAMVTVIGMGALFPNGYDVLVYFDGSDSAAAWATDYAIGAQVLRGTDLPNTDFTGAFVQDSGAGGNYVRFEHLQGDTLALSAAPLAGSTATINAIQLIHAPEPATLGLVGLGALSSFLVRLRRRRGGPMWLPCRCLSWPAATAALKAGRPHRAAPTQRTTCQNPRPHPPMRRRGRKVCHPRVPSLG